MRKKIVILLFLAMTVACQVNERQKFRYDTNKFILLAALLNDYYQKEGLYPLTLQEVEKNYRDFLESHPDVKKKFFLESWTYKETKVPFLGTAYGRIIQYFVTHDRQEYYLWDGLEDFAVNLTTLQKIREGKIFLWHHIAFIYNGRPIRLQSANETNKITLENMESLFRETKRPMIPELTF